MVDIESGLNPLLQRVAEYGLNVNEGLEEVFATIRAKVFELMGPITVEEKSALLDALTDRFKSGEGADEESYDLGDNLNVLRFASSSWEGDFAFADVDSRNGDLVMGTAHPNPNDPGVCLEQICYLTENEAMRLKGLLEDYSKSLDEQDGSGLDIWAVNGLLDLLEEVSENLSQPRSLESRWDDEVLTLHKSNAVVITELPDEQKETFDFFTFFKKLLSEEWRGEKV